MSPVTTVYGEAPQPILTQQRSFGRVSSATLNFFAPALQFWCSYD